MALQYKQSLSKIEERLARKEKELQAVLKDKKCTDCIVCTEIHSAKGAPQESLLQ